PVSWTEAPHVAAFPDRFAVLGYRGGEQVLEALGGPITLPLYVGPDPSADPDDAIHPEGADLAVPDELSWLVDFDAAVAAGLGIDPSVLQAVHAAGGADQARARAMQRALWPATLGYWLDKLLAPAFDDQTVADLRAYFTSYVRGRGALPAVRIGGQAYGVL